MKNIFGGRLSLLTDEFSDRELGQLTRAVAAYAEEGTRTEFKDRGMRLAYELILSEYRQREQTRVRTARYRERKKNGEEA